MGVGTETAARDALAFETHEGYGVGAETATFWLQSERDVGWDLGSRCYSLRSFLLCGIISLGWKDVEGNGRVLEGESLHLVR